MTDQSPTPDSPTPDSSAPDSSASESAGPLQPAARLSAAVFCPRPVFVPQLAAALVSVADLRLREQNPMWGAAEVDGMRVQVSSVLESGDTSGVRSDAERAATWTDGVEPLLGAATCHVVASIEGITEPRAAQNLLSRLLTAIVVHFTGDMGADTEPDCVVHVPTQHLATTGSLYLRARGRDAAEPHVATWFTVFAWWEGEKPVDPQHPHGATSAAFTSGLHAMGLPEVQMVGVPWSPVDVRDTLQRVVTDLLRQNIAPQAGIEFELGPMPMILVNTTDPNGAEPMLALLPRSVAINHGLELD